MERVKGEERGKGPIGSLTLCLFFLSSGEDPTSSLPCPFPLLYLSWCHPLLPTLLLLFGCCSMTLATVMQLWVVVPLTDCRSALRVAILCFRSPFCALGSRTATHYNSCWSRWLYSFKPSWCYRGALGYPTSWVVPFGTILSLDYSYRSPQVLPGVPWGSQKYKDFS